MTHAVSDFQYEYGVETMMPLDRIVPNPEQPREFFDESQHGDIRQLAAGMSEYKQVQAIEVFPLPMEPNGHGQKFMVLSGERRLRAAILNHAAAIRAVVVPAIDKEELYVDSFIANSTVPHTHIENYRALLYMRDRCGLSVDKITARLGRKRDWVEQYFKLETLAPEALDLLDPKKTQPTLSLGHALLLVGVDAGVQQSLARSWLDRGLSVAQSKIAVNRVPKTLSPPARNAGFKGGTNSGAAAIESAHTQPPRPDWQLEAFAKKLSLLQVFLKATRRGSESWASQTQSMIDNMFGAQPPQTRKEALRLLRESLKYLDQILPNLGVLLTKFDPKGSLTAELPNLEMAFAKTDDAPKEGAK